MKSLFKAAAFTVMLTFMLSACGRSQSDLAGPLISDISTSDKVVVISDCPATSVIITAKVTDTSNVTDVRLWYRVGADQPFVFTYMDMQNDRYIATIKGSDLQGHGYGVMEFYITAEDAKGNSSESPLDNSIQFLPCVNN